MNRREVDRLIERWQATGKIHPQELAELEEYVAFRGGAADDLQPILPLLARDARETALTNETANDSFESIGTPITGSNQADFTDAVMQRVKTMRKPARRRINAGRVAATVGLAAALAVVIGVWHWPGGDSPEPVAENQQADSLTVRFELIAPEASSVSLVGDFNDWNEKSHTLRRSEDGEWVIDMKLQRGELYSYNFLVDKEIWVPDPQADYEISDPFGGKKSVMSL